MESAVETRAAGVAGSEVDELVARTSRTSSYPGVMIDAALISKFMSIRNNRARAATQHSPPSTRPDEMSSDEGRWGRGGSGGDSAS